MIDFCRTLPETLESFTFKVNLGKCSEKAKESKVEIKGQGLKSATTGQLAEFTVHIRDSKRKRHPVEHCVSAELKFLVDESVFTAKVVSKPPVYQLSYTPTTRGRHELTVCINETKIGTFQVFVQHPPTELGTPVRDIEEVSPWYIAVNDKGELFVTEHEEYRYTVLDSQGQRVLTIGSKGKAPFWDEGPTGIATDGKGNVYVASAYKLQKFNRDGEVITSVGKEGKDVGNFNYLENIRYHKHQVYVCDSSNGRVQVFDSDLKFVRSFAIRGNPVDVDFDSQGNMYVLDSSQKQILVFNEDGEYQHRFGQNKYSDLEKLCIHGDYVYVTQWANHSVSVFQTSGKYVGSTGKGKSDEGELKYPRGIAVDQDGFVFVCDSHNSCIQVF